MKTLPFPRGVVDPSRRWGFLQTPRDNVVGVELESGRELWRSDAAGEPVAAGDEDLWVVSYPKLLRLSPRSGEVQGELPLPFTLPVGVEPEEVELEAEAQGSTVSLFWGYNVEFAGGAAVSEETRRGLERRAQGAAEWSPSTGSWRAVPESPRVPLEETASWPYRQRGSWRERAWHCGDVGFRLVTEPREDGLEERVALERFEARAKPTPTGQGWMLPIEPTVTPDGCYLLVHPLAAVAGRWEVLDLKTGQVAGRVPFVSGSQFPAVLDGSLYFLTGPPASLHAVHLASGSERWRLPLDSPERLNVRPLPRMR